MKVYLDPPSALGQGIKRVARELVHHAPVEVTFTTDRHDADHIVHHVVGVGNFSAVALPELIAQDAKPYSMVQYCVRTSEWSPFHWWTLWQAATVVWSYYDLPALLPSGAGQPGWFYHAPLGVSRDIADAAAPQSTRDYLVGTSGYVAEAECIDVWAEVARQFSQKQAHLGPPLRCFTDTVATYQGLKDAELGRLWSRCQFVNGLRATEGFELPAIEGLACGARPVVFDRPEHRQWLQDMAEYIDEAQPVLPQLQRLVINPYRPVDPLESTRARYQFDWKRICAGFWSRLLEAPHVPRRPV